MAANDINSNRQVAWRKMRSLSRQILETFAPQERETLRDLMPYFIRTHVAKYQYSQRLMANPGPLDSFFQSPLVANGNLTLDNVMNVLGIGADHRTRTFNTIVKHVDSDLILRAEKGKRGGNARIPAQLELTFMGFICACQVHRNPRAKLVQRLAAKCTELVCQELVGRAIEEAGQATTKAIKMKKRVRAGNRGVGFGMHRGRTFACVWNYYRSYCDWIMKLTTMNKAQQELYDYVKAKLARE